MLSVCLYYVIYSCMLNLLLLCSSCGSVVSDGLSLAHSSSLFCSHRRTLWVYCSHIPEKVLQDGVSPIWSRTAV